MASPGSPLASKATIVTPRWTQRFWGEAGNVQSVNRPPVQRLTEDGSSGLRLR
jgi:hypothetical protein